MQNLTAFFTAFDPLALLFVAGIFAFVVVGGMAVMKDVDVTAFDPDATEKSGASDPPAAEPARLPPTDEPTHGGAGGRRRGRAA